MSIILSLDCELLWGVSDFASDNYIKNNIKNSDKTLRSIIQLSEQKKISNKLYLAFVLNSMDFENQNDAWSFSKLTIDIAKNSECSLGLHSTNHKLYSKLSVDDYEIEVKKIQYFLQNNKRFSSFFVFPKNQLHNSGSKNIFQLFDNVRVNCDSWLYKSLGQNYSLLKRIIRYLDSFLPIYEIFCSKNPEVNQKNAIVGTHFFRANLRGFFLLWHYNRLKLGKHLMNKKNKSMHVWSHPHNFNGNEKAIKLFVNLGKL